MTPHGSTKQPGFREFHDALDDLRLPALEQEMQRPDQAARIREGLRQYLASLPRPSDSGRMRLWAEQAARGPLSRENLIAAGQALQYLLIMRWMEASWRTWPRWPWSQALAQEQFQRQLESLMHRLHEDLARFVHDYDAAQPQTSAPVSFPAMPEPSLMEHVARQQLPILRQTGPGLMNYLSRMRQHLTTLDPHLQALVQIEQQIRTTTTTSAPALQQLGQRLTSVPETLSRTQQHVETLETVLQPIHDAATAIRRVARQTNFLAMNAAIEVARAGWGGWGRICGGG